MLRGLNSSDYILINQMLVDIKLYLRSYSGMVVLKNDLLFLNTTVTRRMSIYKKMSNQEPNSPAIFFWLRVLQLYQHIQLCQDIAYLVFRQHFPS